MLKVFFLGNIHAMCIKCDMENCGLYKTISIIHAKGIWPITVSKISVPNIAGRVIAKNIQAIEAFCSLFLPFFAYNSSMVSAVLSSSAKQMCKMCGEEACIWCSIFGTQTVTDRAGRPHNIWLGSTTCINNRRNIANRQCNNCVRSGLGGTGNIWDWCWLLAEWRSQHSSPAMIYDGACEQNISLIQELYVQIHHSGKFCFQLYNNSINLWDLFCNYSTVASMDRVQFCRFL